MCAGPDGVARSAAGRIAAALRRRPARLGVATGRTVTGTYELLPALVGDAAGVDLFLLDDYVGLQPGDPRGFRATVLRQIADPLGIAPARVHGPLPGEGRSGLGGPDLGDPDLGDPDLGRPDLGGSDLDRAADDFERLVSSDGGLDLQVLGVGANGHVGFNEPGSSLDSLTRVVELAPSTRQANAAFFGCVDDVPTRAITQGLATILRARELLLLATGAHKAPAVAAALTGPVTSAVPASVLQRHPRVTVILDEAAASEPPGPARAGRR